MGSRERPSRATLANAEQADTRLTIAIAELSVAMQRYAKPLHAAKLDPPAVDEVVKRVTAYAARLRTDVDVHAGVELATWLLDQCLTALRRELRAMVEIRCAQPPEEP
jgi:hypothetical protein